MHATEIGRSLDILQVNVDRRVAAQNLIFQTAAREGADLVLVSEPNKAMARGKGWYTDDLLDVCIVKRNPFIKITGWGRGMGHAWVRIGEMYVFATYISPNVTDEAYGMFLQGLQDSMADKGHHIIFGGISMPNLHYGAPHLRIEGGECWRIGSLAKI